MEKAVPKREKMPRVEIFVDGACSGNPGPGGWAAILRTSKQERELAGAALATTNNRMELMGAIVALEKLKRHRRVKVYSDSRYVIDGASIWIHSWKRKGWRTAAGSEVMNIDLWHRLDSASLGHDIKWIWVKGHAGHPGNVRADHLARAALEGLRLS